MYEHIAYELKYGNLSSIEHGLICMKAHFFYLITLIELLIHIEHEQHSLRVLTPERDYKR